MRRIIRLILLKMADLFNRPLMLAILFAIPLLLGFFAGASNQNNRRSDMVVAIVDEDQSMASQELIDTLQTNGCLVSLETLQSAERLILQQKVDGILYIRAGFDENLINLLKPYLEYTPANDSLVTTMVQEAIAAALLPEFSRRSMTEQLLQIYRNNGMPVPANLADSVAEQIRQISTSGNLLQVDYIGNMKLTPTLTFVVSDYSLEVFFLSIYAILGSLALSGLALKRRLAAASHGLALDFLTTQISLLGLGIFQILLYTGAMNTQMADHSNVSDIGSLVVYLFLMLGVSQLLVLLDESVRLFLSLMTLLLLSIAGGCFFSLSTIILTRVGLYTPQGWVLNRIRGVSVMPIPVVLLLTLAMMLIGYLVSRRRVHRH
jgi:hypothetical protein